MEFKVLADEDGNDALLAWDGFVFCTLTGTVCDLVQDEYTNCYQQPCTCIWHPPAPLPHILTVYKTDYPDQFCGALCVTPRTFDHLLEMISGDPVFATEAGHQQIPLETQLGVALF
jgi:hypothetical protein